MQIYFMDDPLREEEISELGIIVAQWNLVDDQAEIVQHRVPILFPVPEAEGRYGRRLSRYVPLIRKQLLKAGVSPRGDEAIALLMPREPVPSAGVLALALAEVAHRAPYIVVRRAGHSPRVRLIDAGELLRWLRRGTGRGGGSACL